MKVVKFGGTSLASGKQIQKVLNIVISDPKRKIVVVSAPGKRFADDTKVTDLLIACARKKLRGEDATDWLEAVVERFESIAMDLEMSNDIVKEIRADLEERLRGYKGDPERFLDHMKAAGEDNNAKLIAAYFQERGIEARYVSPKEAGLIVTDEPGNARVLPESSSDCIRCGSKEESLFFPDFSASVKTGMW